MKEPKAISEWRRERGRQIERARRETRKARAFSLISEGAKFLTVPTCFCVFHNKCVGFQEPFLYLLR